MRRWLLIGLLIVYYLWVSVDSCVFVSYIIPWYQSSHWRVFPLITSFHYASIRLGKMSNCVPTRVFRIIAVISTRSDCRVVAVISGIIFSFANVLVRTIHANSLPHYPVSAARTIDWLSLMVIIRFDKTLQNHIFFRHKEITNPPWQPPKECTRIMTGHVSFIGLFETVSTCMQCMEMRYLRRL